MVFLFRKPTTISESTIIFGGKITKGKHAFIMQIGDTELPKMEKAINRLIASITKTVSELTTLKDSRLLWQEVEKRIGSTIAEVWGGDDAVWN